MQADVCSKQLSPGRKHTTEKTNNSYIVNNYKENTAKGVGHIHKPSEVERAAFTTKEPVSVIINRAPLLLMSSAREAALWNLQKEPLAVGAISADVVGMLWLLSVYRAPREVWFRGLRSTEVCRQQSPTWMLRWRSKST